jgi:hypothetical protein
MNATVLSSALDSAIAAKVSKATKAPKAPKNAPVVSPLDTLFNASFGLAKSDDELRLAFVAAGGNQDAPRKALISGRMAYALAYTREKALLAIDKKGNPKHVPSPSDDQRTVAEEKAYGAARVFLSARLKAWGIKSASTQGGDRTSSGPDKSMDTEKLKMPGKPKIESETDLGAYALAFAKSGYDLFLLNKEHAAVKTALGSELMGAFSDFADEIREIVKEFAPK